MSEIVLSIGMIVKNEIRCIEKCLKALEPLRKAVPSELVIADTGSTDGTREIAARYADIFFDIPWENDFAAARNAVLARCSGKWYFSIDADEYLDNKIDNLVQFLIAPSETDLHADFALITIFNYVDQNLDKETASSFLAIRLARIKPGLQYTGKIHEQFTCKENANYKNLPDGFLWHDGYAFETPEKRRSKMRRNIEILEAELQKDPKNPLRIIQCIESSRNNEEKLKYINHGMNLLLSNEPGWKQQGASLLRYAIQWAASVGSTQIQEWLKLAYTRYPESPVTQIDINKTMVGYYQKCRQWKQLLKAADAYWNGIQRLDRDEFPPDIFASVLVSEETQTAREQVSLFQAEACYYLGRHDLAIEILKKVPLKKVVPIYIGGLIGLLAKLAQKVDVSKLFCDDIRDILRSDSASQEDWRRKDAVQNSLKCLFEAEEDEYPLPVSMLLRLKDDVFAPAAAIMSAKSKAELLQIVESDINWRQMPTIVIEKLVREKISLPNVFFQSMGFNEICQTADYLAKRANMTECMLDFADTLDPDDERKAVWRFELAAQSCIWFKWKNENIANRLYNAFCTSAKRFLAIAYPAELLNMQYADAVLPPICRFASLCLKMEHNFQDGDYHTCICIMKEMLILAPSMREMIMFLTGRLERTVKEQRLKACVTPEMITIAKQIRTILTQYSEDDAAVFVLKNSDQYQKMKFLIEDPNLDNL